MGSVDEVLARPADAVIFDLDGTLTDCRHRLHFVEDKPQEGKKKKDWKAFFEAGVHDTPHKHMIQLAAVLTLFRFKLVFCTGRPESYRGDTLAWLGDHVKFRHDALLMRRDGDYRPDTEVKSEMVDEIVNQFGFKPVLAFDDRQAVAEMFQKRGIPCLVFDQTLGGYSCVVEGDPDDGTGNG
jgi:phosphoglycolate phosphatase-like HAD superfamily hydrolase